jgi:hypothetical protein
VSISLSSLDEENMATFTEAVGPILPVPDPLIDNDEAPPPKTIGIKKKAKALLYGAGATRRKFFLSPAFPPPSQVSLAAELVAKSVTSEIDKSEIAKLAGTTQCKIN